MIKLLLDGWKMMGMACMAGLFVLFPAWGKHLADPFAMDRRMRSELNLRGKHAVRLLILLACILFVHAPDLGGLLLIVSLVVFDLWIRGKAPYTSIMRRCAKAYRKAVAPFNRALTSRAAAIRDEVLCLRAVTAKHTDRRSFSALMTIILRPRLSIGVVDFNLAPQVLPTPRANLGC